MSVTVLELVRSAPAAWVWMPAFLLRIQRFALQFEPGGLEHARWLRDSFARAFGAGDGRMLGLLAVDGNDAVGHVLAGVEVLEGRTLGWIYQVEHTAAPDRGLAGLLQVLVERWAAARGLSSLVGSAASDSRARRFEELGWTRGGRVMHKEVQHVESLRGRRLVDDRETGDSAGAAPADPADH